MARSMRSSGILPSKVIKELGWKKGQELEAEIKGEKLVIEKD